MPVEVPGEQAEKKQKLALPSVLSWRLVRHDRKVKVAIVLSKVLEVQSEPVAGDWLF